MTFLSNRTPNIDKLASKKDVDGLIDALSYGKRRQKSLPPPGTEGFEKGKAEVVKTERAAVSALAEIGDPRAITPILECFTENRLNVFQIPSCSTPWSWEPVVLSKFGAPAVEPLIDTLNHGYPGMQSLAAVALGHIGDPRAIPPLLAKGDYPPEAIWALGNIGGNGKIVDALISALDPPHTSGVRHRLMRYATHALGSGRLGNTAADALADVVEREILKGNIPPGLAVVALCELGDRRGLEAALDHQIEPFVLMAIGKFDDPRVRKLLAAELERSYPNRRLSVGSGQRYLYAALGLAANGDSAAVRPLIDVLADPGSRRTIPWLSDPRTEYDLAMNALRELGQVAIVSLRALAKDPDPRIRACAELANLDLSRELRR